LLIKIILWVDEFLFYCEDLKKITVSLDEETNWRARIKSAARDTSVSALVKGFLLALALEPGTRGLEREEHVSRAHSHLHGW
jgi:hypothetical protein